MSRNFIESLIKCYQSEPTLWQVKSEAYRDRRLKKKGWEKMLKLYKQFDGEATVDTVKKKINALRASYRRELQKIKKSEEAGRNWDDDIYIPSLFYFDQLHFLRNQENDMEDEWTDDPLEKETPKPSKRSRSIMDNCAERPVKTPEKTEKQPEKLETVSKKKRALEDEFLKRAVRYLDKSNMQAKKDDAAIFAEGWALQYRKLDEHQQIYAKHIIDDALIQGQLGLLRFESARTSAQEQPEQQEQQHVSLQHKSEDRTYCSTPQNSSDDSVYFN